MNYKAYNGYGGFNITGDEYEVFNTHTPVPWCNVLTNERFGTLVSTYGTVYSFYKNAGEFKLTHWCNDWADFKPGEKFRGVTYDFQLYYKPLMPDIRNSCPTFLKKGLEYFKKDVMGME